MMESNLFKNKILTTNNKKKNYFKLFHNKVTESNLYHHMLDNNYAQLQIKEVKIRVLINIKT